MHPLRPLYDACRFLIRTHARRLPLIDKDPQTDGEVVISVLTQYRVLKFIAQNVSCLPRFNCSQLTFQCRDITQYLTGSVQALGIGTYISPDNPSQPEDADYNPFYPLATATLETTVFDVVHMFSEQGISAVPIVDEQGKVINLYETVDVIVSVPVTRLYRFVSCCALRNECESALTHPDTSAERRLSIARSQHDASAQTAFTRFPRCSYLFTTRLARSDFQLDQD